MQEHIELLVDCFRTQLNLLGIYSEGKSLYQTLQTKSQLTVYETRAKECEELAEKTKAQLIECYKKALVLQYETLVEENRKALDQT